MSGNAKFRGVGVALVTPFLDDGSLDEATLQRFVAWQVEKGTDYLVPCGTTGENPALSEKEHLRVIELTVKTAGGRVPVLAGAGSNSTPRAVDLALASIDLGADGILTITPFYNKPTPDGLLRHFGAQAEAVRTKRGSFPMITYNVPGRTGCNMTAATTLRIAREIPEVIGVKEASGNLEQIMDILRMRADGFLVISGDDAMTLPLLALGADGLISVASNEIPSEMKQLVSAGLAGDFATARDIHYRFLPLLNGNFMESSPTPAKTALAMMGVLPNDLVRSPLAPLTAESRKRLQEILSGCGVISTGA
jgi:4-hydroxy-tetrahydrodipicolinate synthase